MNNEIKKTNGDFEVQYGNEGKRQPEIVASLNREEADWLWKLLPDRIQVIQSPAWYHTFILDKPGLTRDMDIIAHKKVCKLLAHHWKIKEND